MIIQNLGPKLELEESNKFDIEHGITLYPIYKGSGWVGVVSLKPSNKVTIASNSEKYAFKSRDKSHNLIFVLYGDNPIIRVRRKTFYIKKYYQSEYDRYIVRYLRGNLSDYGSWLSIGFADYMLEVWPISITWPITCIVRLWNKKKKEAVLTINFNGYSRELELPLKNIGIINVSDYLLLIFDNMQKAVLSYSDIAFDLINLTEIRK